MEEQIRTFVAVELSEDVKSGLTEIETRLSQQIVKRIGAAEASKALKWVEPASVHVTLKFLGSIPTARLAAIETALRRAAIDKRPLDLELSGLGAFPNTNRPRVIWLGVRGEVADLTKLQSDVEAQLVALGFSRDARSFSAHLTVARLREGTRAPELKKIGEIVDANAQTEALAIEVGSISLMRSDLTPAGARYTRIVAIALSGLAST